VSQKLVVRALSQVSGVDDSVIAHRLMGEWQPTPAFFAQLIATETEDADISRPYPFFLAYPIEERLKDYEVKQGEALQTFLGDIHDWQTEWKWDGIRAQVIRRAGKAFVWSRGEENITERFPEIAAIGDALPDGTVIDGEVLPFKDNRVLPFAQLQLRIGRKTVSKKLLADVPVVLMAYDLLEWQGEDVREWPLAQRREQLAKIVASCNMPALMLSPLAEADTWAGLIAMREESRERNAEGFMLKRKTDAYGVGRVVGSWWKWKINPFTVDAVLIYAQRGHGKRASLYTDYTFGVWNDERTELISFAKAYSGLTDAEIREVDAFVRRNTVEKFGPVRTVTPALVFELAFEGIQRSSRHKSGIAVRFPRMLRWRRDKPIAEADSLASIRALLPE
jgi:DNA ligase-1